MIVVAKDGKRIPKMEDGRRKQRNCVRARMKSKMGGESNDGRRKQKWEEKLCEGEDEGDKRLPVSHLQFPPLPVIRAAQPRELAASWQPTSNFPFLGPKHCLGLPGVNDHHVQLHVWPVVKI